MFRNLLSAGVATALSFAAASSAMAEQCTNDVFKKVLERGKVVIGVKADYKPWGYRDTSGNIVGMEADMARSAADAMGEAAAEATDAAGFEELEDATDALLDLLASDWPE